MKRVWVFLLVAALVSGCVNLSQEQYNRDKAAADQICDLRSNPALQPLVGKIPLSASERENPPMRMLTLDTYPTDDERVALQAFDELMVPCRAANDAIGQRYSGQTPEVASIRGAYKSAVRGITADLYLRKRTYADANRQMQAVRDEARQAISKVISAYNAHQQELAASYFQTYMNSLPVTTTCYGGSGFATCTTR